MAGRNDFDQSLIKQMFKVKITLAEMLRDRGYMIDKDQWLLDETTKTTDFLHHYERISSQSEGTFRESLAQTYEKDNDPTGKFSLRVFFPETPVQGGEKKGIGKAQIDRILKYMTDHTVTRVIIVTETALSSQAAGQLRKYPAWHLEHFMYKELGYNVTKHFFVPAHRLMNLDEITQFLEGNDINIEDLPIMSIQDPIARYYGAKAGDLFEVERFDIIGTSMVSNSLAHRAVREIPLIMPVQKKQT